MPQEHFASHDLVASYTELERATEAVRALREAGIDESRIDVHSQAEEGHILVGFDSADAAELRRAEEILRSHDPQVIDRLG
jgi:pyruvate formate-lyase activating enzyme-like uncharacterized protein